jgi:hypothetical protein
VFQSAIAMLGLDKAKFVAQPQQAEANFYF